MLDILEVF